LTSGETFNAKLQTKLCKTVCH